MPRPRGPILCLEFLLLSCNPGMPVVLLQTQRRCDNKQLGARHADHASPAICLEDGNISAHPHIRRQHGGTRVGQQRQRQNGLLSRANPTRDLLGGEASTHSRLHRMRARRKKKMADAVSRLTHLPYQKFLSHFYTHFSQRKP